MLFKRTNFYQKKSRDTNKKDIFIQGHVIFEQTQRLKAKNKRFILFSSRLALYLRRYTKRTLYNNGHHKRNNQMGCSNHLH